MFISFNTLIIINLKGVLVDWLFIFYSLFENILFVKGCRSYQWRVRNLKGDQNMSYKRIWPNFVRKGHIRWADNKMSAKNTKKKPHDLQCLYSHFKKQLNFFYFITHNYTYLSLQGDYILKNANIKYVVLWS